MLNKTFTIISNEKILLISLPLAFIILMLLLPVNFFFKIKFGLLHSDRIGHFVADDVINYLEKKKIQKKNSLNIFYFGRVPCNKYLAKLWSRRVIIMPKFIIRPFCLITRQLNIFNKFHFGFSEASDQDVNLVIENNPIFFEIQNDEKIYGENLIKKILEK